jgi:hypothetical protein
MTSCNRHNTKDTSIKHCPKQQLKSLCKKIDLLLHACQSLYATT